MFSMPERLRPNSTSFRSSNQHPITHRQGILRKHIREFASGPAAPALTMSTEEMERPRVVRLPRVRRHKTSGLFLREVAGDTLRDIRANARSGAALGETVSTNVYIYPFLSIDRIVFK